MYCDQRRQRSNSPNIGFVVTGCMDAGTEKGCRKLVWMFIESEFIFFSDSGCQWRYMLDRWVFVVGWKCSNKCSVSLFRMFDLWWYISVENYFTLHPFFFNTTPQTQITLSLKHKWNALVQRKHRAPNKSLPQTAAYLLSRLHSCNSLHHKTTHKRPKSFKLSINRHSF